MIDDAFNILDSHLSDFLAYKRYYRLIQTSTLFQINRELLLFFRFLYSKHIFSIKETNTKTILKYFRFIKLGGFKKTRKSRKGSVLTVSTKRSNLWSYFNYLCKMGYLAENPVDFVPIPLLEKKAPLVLSINEVIKLFKIIMNKQRIKYECKIRDRAFVGLILFYGLHSQEIFGLNLADINFRKNVLIVGESCSHDQRVLPLFFPIKEWLLEYKKVRRKTKSLLFFQNVRTGTPYNPSNAERSLGYLAMKLRRKLTPKILQNTFLSILFNNKINNRVIQSILGAHTINSINKRSMYFNNPKVLDNKYFCSKCYEA